MEKVIKLVTEDATAGIGRRFAEVHEKKPHAEHNVEAGRASAGATHAAAANLQLCRGLALFTDKEQHPLRSLQR